MVTVRKTIIYQELTRDQHGAESFRLPALEAVTFRLSLTGEHGTGLALFLFPFF